MIKILYANGCSMTEGAELGNLKFNFDESSNGPSSTRQNHMLTSPEHAAHMEAHAYPNRLRVHLGIPNHENGALCGSSNRRIVRTTIKDIEKLCEEYDPSEIFVKIGFTSMDRFEFFFANKFHQIVPNTVKAKGNHHYNMGKKNFKYLEERCDIGNESIVELLTNHFMEVLALKNYLDNKKIKYLFSYGLTNIMYGWFPKVEIDQVVKNEEIQTMYKLIGYTDPKIWVLDGGTRLSSLDDFLIHIREFTFYEFCIKRKLKTGNGHHPLEHAHESWAKFLDEYIRRYGIIDVE